jgi:Zn-dependent oligopeptidase
MEAVEGQMGQGMYRGFLLAARKKSEEIKEIENALRRLSPDQIQELADSLSQPPKAHLQIESPRSGEVVLAQRISNAQASAAKRKAAAAAKKAAATPTSTVDIVSESRKKIAEVEGQFNKGIITDGERYSKVVDIIAKLEAVSLFKKAACRRSGTSA